MLEKSDNVELEGQVSGPVNSVPLRGKQDLSFEFQGLNVIFDWKVNGFCTYTSPKKLYLDCDGKRHKNAGTFKENGIEIGNVCLENIFDLWASQMSIYAWLLWGYGSNFLVIIDQITRTKAGRLRVSHYRNKVSPLYQGTVWRRIKFLWDNIQAEHMFPEMTLEQSRARQEILDDYWKAYTGNDPL